MEATLDARERSLEDAIKALERQLPLMNRLKAQNLFLQ
jgi:hypothetical protein